MKSAEIALAIGAMFGLALATAIGIIVGSHLLGPRRSKSRTKFEVYECGVLPLDTSRRRFSVKFYLVALVFLLFDIETVFLIPWAVNYFELGILGFAETLVFLFVLALGLVYIWKRGALDWE